jgi:hypothetical protein
MNSLQAGLIGVSVLVIAAFAAWMWWQNWRSNREERLRVEQRNSSRQSERSPRSDVSHSAPVAAPASRGTEVSESRSARELSSLPDYAEERGDVRVVNDRFVETTNPANTVSPSVQAMYSPRAGEDSDSPALDAAALPDVDSSSTPISATASSMRVEPNVSAREADTFSQETISKSPKTVAVPTTLPLDERLNVYAIASALDGQAIDCQDFVPLADGSLAWGRVFRMSAWEYIDDLASGGAMQSLCLGMPLASRAGPVSTSDALNWKNEVSLIAGRLGYEVKFGGDVSVGERAAELDQFLAAADVICVLYLVRKDSGAWSGTRLRGTLEANGFRLQSDGRFVYFEVESEMPIFSAVDGFERSFTPERLRTENISALRLVFEASNVQNPVARFDVFRQTLRALARLLEADIKDNEGAIVGDAEFTGMRTDVQAGSAALAEAGIECGSPTARALFR